MSKRKGAKFHFVCCRRARPNESGVTSSCVNNVFQRIPTFTTCKLPLPILEVTSKLRRGSLWQSQAATLTGCRVRSISKACRMYWFSDILITVTLFACFHLQPRVSCAAAMKNRAHYVYEEMSV